jgi:acetyltransferase-like isoleucine patch superfamily enzyme
MSLLWTLLGDGDIAPTKPRTWRQRLLYKLGRKLAMRGGRVHLHASCLIHPEARICPRASEIRMGENGSVAGGAAVQGNVSIGDNCSVQAYTLLVGYGKSPDDDGAIVLGNDVRIAGHCMIIAGNHVFADPDRPIRTQGLTPGTICIKDDVWIGGNVNIVAGVTIGRGAVIGAGSVVTRDIPPYAIAVGSPARVVKSRLAGASRSLQN